MTKVNSVDYIRVRGAKENNLQNIDIDIPVNQLVVITGPSGSGKSSLAFDTLYAEGQRRYVESLSSYARYFLNIQNKPDVESITGLSPAIAIDQKTTSRNPRSTVGTVTEIYDYLRLLFARVGTVYSPSTNLPIEKYSASEIIARVSQLPLETKIRICAPVVKNQLGSCTKELQDLKRKGYQRIKINGKVVDLEQIAALDEKTNHTIEVIVDRIIIKQNMGTRLVDSIENCMKLSAGIVNLDIVELQQENIVFNNREISTGATVTFSEKFACPVSGFMLEEIEPKIFSFNSPFGACKVCNGLGTEVFFKEDLIVPDPNLSLAQGAIEPWTRNDARYHNQLILSLSKYYNFDINIPYSSLPDNVKAILLYGSKGEKIPIVIQDDYRKHVIEREFCGVIEELKRKLDSSEDDPLIVNECERYQTLTNCHVCQGHRLRSESLQVKIADLHIGQVTDLPIEDAIKWFNELSDKLSNNNKEIARPILKEIRDRLGFLANVGLEYLTLSRSANTLSGGESQRIRLASQIGSGLCGVLYVLDEPSIGLHQSDNDKLIAALKNLRDMGNSVVVIEHDEETMRSADYIIDVGPGAGKYGGHIIAEGTLEQILQNKKSITGLFLSGEMGIETPKARRKYGKGNHIEIKNAREHNLKNINATIPLGMFVAVSGISGGGKSTLIIDTLYNAVAQKLHSSKEKPGRHDEITGLENIDKVIKIDQSPIGRTPRSNPATYTGLFTLIRDWFSALPDSRARGYKSSRFSFNVKGGRCENCQGDGLIKIEMHFLPDVYIDCDVCKGQRYNKETLEVKYKTFSIADVLNMTVREAMDLFDNIAAIQDKLHSLYNVGLDYIKLGQSSTTLSGGEAQRIKLAKELAKKATGNTLYILDEPTTGLHSADIKRLLTVLHTLVDYGNTVLVIEHNIDVIKTADYVLDIGPRGGSSGGRIVAHGTPEDVAASQDSVTGKYLLRVLDKQRVESARLKFAKEKNI
jgi:excinuclease ABC subunit A